MIKKIVIWLVSFLVASLIFLPCIIYLLLAFFDALSEGCWYGLYFYLLLLLISMLFVDGIAIRFFFVEELERWKKLILYVVFSISNFYVFLVNAGISLTFFDNLDNLIDDILVGDFAFSIFGYFIRQSICISIFVFFFVIVMLIDNIIRQDDILFAKNWLIITLTSAAITISITIFMINSYPKFF